MTLTFVTNAPNAPPSHVRSHVSYTNVDSNVGRKGNEQTLLEKVNANNVYEGPKANVSGHVSATNVEVNVDHFGLER